MTATATKLLVLMVWFTNLRRNEAVPEPPNPLPCEPFRCIRGCKCPLLPEFGDCASDSFPWELYGWLQYADLSKKTSMGEFEIRKVGGICETPPCLPAGKILSYVPGVGLHGQIHFEAHSEIFGLGSTPDIPEYEKLKVEMYGGVVNAETGAPCDQVGTIIDKSILNWHHNTFPFDSYNEYYAYANGEQLRGQCYPGSTNGRVGSAEFFIDDPFFDDIADDMKIWYPGQGENDGLLTFCLRVVVQAPVLGNMLDQISFIDTMVKTSVDLSADFSTFGQDIMISQEASATVESEISPELFAVAFLCNEDGSTTSSGNQFRSGQEFQICLEPSGNLMAAYDIAGFESVICKNNSTSRALITGGNADFLTTIVDNVGGRNYMKAFRSVVTADFLKNGETSFVCTGSVNLEPKITDVQVQQGVVQLEFDLVTTGPLVHGFCLLNAKNEKIKTSTNITYTNKGILRYGFSGISFVPPDSDENELTNIDSNELCLGGSYWQSSIAVVDPGSFGFTQITATTDSNGMTVCMFLEEDSDMGDFRDGGLARILNTMNWRKSEMMAGLGTKYNKVRVYCFDFNSGIHHIKVEGMYSCRRLSNNTYSIGSIGNRDAATSPRRLQESELGTIRDSPFATVVRLSSPGGRFSAAPGNRHGSYWIAIVMILISTLAWTAFA